MSPEDMQRYQFVEAWPDKDGPVTWLTHDPCGWTHEVQHGERLPELVQRAEEHGEVCR